MATPLELSREIDIVVGKLIPPGSSVALFDFPNYANVGDSAIWLGQEAYFAANGCRVVHRDDCATPRERLPAFSDDVIIALSGGGNFGDIWPIHQRFREMVALHYSRNRIVQLPQSIFFENTASAAQSSHVLAKHSDFHLLVRDRPSLEIAQEVCSGNAHLCPDMAFVLTKLSRTQQPTRPITGLMRRDKERLVEQEDIEPPYYACDWLDESPALRRYVNKLTNIERRLVNKSSGMRGAAYKFAAHRRLRRGCDILSTGEVVITDRLHGHILCTLMAIPHVILDNSYGKIGNFRALWNTGSGDLCVQAGSVAEAANAAESLRRAHH